MTAVRRRLIKGYLILSLGQGIGFVLIHALLTKLRGLPPQPAGDYDLYLWIASAVTCIAFHRLFVRKTTMDNTTGLLIPVMFIFGSFMSSYGMLNIYNDFTQPVVTLDTVDLIKNSNANYFQIRKINPDVAAMRDRIEFFPAVARNGNSVFGFDMQYNVVIPLKTKDQGTSVWLELQKNDQPRPDSKEEKDKLRAGALESYRHWARSYPFDSITFFQRGYQKGIQILTKDGQQADDHTVILMPSTGSFGSYQLKEVLMYFGLYMLPSLLLGGVVWSLGSKKSAVT